MAVFLAYLARAYAWLKSTWIGRQVIKYAKKKFRVWAKESLRRVNVKISKGWRSIVQRKAVEKVEEAFKDPKKTSDDRGKAYEDFNNTGR